MKLIQPITMTDAMLVSSSAPETDYTEWAVGTAYIAGDNCIRVSTHKAYECLVGNTGFPPEDNLTGVTPKWLEIGSTNRWAMFDDSVGVGTTLASPLTVVLQPGLITSLAALELAGTTIDVSYKDEPGGTEVYTASKALDATLIYDWASYFFEEFAQLTEWVLDDLPAYLNPEITITITGGTVECGELKFGRDYELGPVEMGATVGIKDYSVKTTDAFGRTTMVVRATAKTAQGRLLLADGTMSRVYALLTRVHATNCVWVGEEGDAFGPLTLYGPYTDFSIEVIDEETSYCSFQLEGLT